MRKKIIKIKNKYYSWNFDQIENIQVWFKGFIFDKNDEYYKDKKETKKLIHELYNKDPEIIKEKLNNYNGHFAFVINSNDFFLACVDRMRTIPLFYLKKDKIVLSDNANRLTKYSNKKVSKLNSIEFLVNKYVTGDETLIEDIHQIQAGECIFSKDNNNLQKIRYYRFHYPVYSKIEGSLEQLQEQLFEVLKSVFKRLIKSLDGAKVAIPLSGGYDSRLILAMLKYLKYDNIVAFTYGDRKSKECKISKEVSNIANVEWKFKNYTTKLFKEAWKSKEQKKYLFYITNLSSDAHYQDLYAVRDLFKGNDDIIFIPGHSGDLIGGKHIPKILINSNDKMLLINEIINKYYNYWKIGDKKIIDKIKDKIYSLYEKDDFDYPLYKLFDSWMDEERVAKFVTNSIRNYEFYSYNWRLPLWDNELVDFFRKIPVEFRYNKQLYDSSLERYFNKLFPQKEKKCNKNKINNKGLEKLKNIFPDLIYMLKHYYSSKNGCTFFKPKMFPLYKYINMLFYITNKYKLSYNKIFGFRTLFNLEKIKGNMYAD